MQSQIAPLDQSVYGPLKCYYGAAGNSWMMRNPGRPMSIYEIAFVLVPENIMPDFNVSGAYPFERHVFDDSEFLASFVTDRPQLMEDVDTSKTLTSAQHLQVEYLPILQVKLSQYHLVAVSRSHIIW